MTQTGRNIKQEILALLGQRDYRPLDKIEMARKLKLGSNESVALRKTLRELEHSGEIARIRKNRYVLPAEADLVTGTISIHQAGYGFLNTETPGQPDVFVAPENTGTAMHGDRVVVRISRDTPPPRGKGPDAVPVILRVDGSGKLTEVSLANIKNASVSLVKNLPDAIASKADIVVLALSVKEFNSLAPYDADALKKRKVIGISYGAAKLYGEIGLKISWGACAHGMEPRIKAEDNATIAKAGFDKVFGVYAPNAPQYPAQDVEYMPFGIFVGYPAIHQGLEDVDVVARFNGDLGYAPIVRQGNKILIGFNPHAEDWSEQFGDLMRKLVAALNAPLKNPVSQPVVAHAPQTLEGDRGDPEAGRVMRLTRTNDGRSCSIEWLPGFANDSEKGFKPTRFDLLGDNVGATELPYGFAMWDHGFKLEYFTARLENDELVLE